MSPSSSESTEASDQVSAWSREILTLNPRRRPRLAESNDVEEPDNAVGCLPDDAVADRAERVVRDRLGRRPLRLARFSREPKTAVSVGILALAAVIDEIQVAIVQLGHAGRVLVRAGRDLGAENAGDLAARRLRACAIAPQARKDSLRQSGPRKISFASTLDGNGTTTARTVYDAAMTILRLVRVRSKPKRIVCARRRLVAT